MIAKDAEIRPFAAARQLSRGNSSYDGSTFGIEGSVGAGDGDGIGLYRQRRRRLPD